MAAGSRVLTRAGSQTQTAKILGPLTPEAAAASRIFARHLGRTANIRSPVFRRLSEFAPPYTLADSSPVASCPHSVRLEFVIVREPGRRKQQWTGQNPSCSR